MFTHLFLFIANWVRWYQPLVLGSDYRRAARRVVDTAGEGELFSSLSHSSLAQTKAR